MKRTIFFFVACFYVLLAQSQSLILSSGSQGKLNLPKLTYDQIQLINSPESGSVVYDVTTNCIRFYNGTKWLCTDQKTNEYAVNTLNAWKVASSDPAFGFQSNQIVVDANGAIYIAGIFSGTIQIGEQSYTAVGYSDVFVIRYDAIGTIQWVKTGGFSNINAFSSDLVIDNAGNLYLGGIFYNQITIGSRTVSANNGSGDVFLCKLSTTNGDVLELKAVGGENYDTLGELFVDYQNNIYMVGNFVGIANFDAFSVTGTDNNDIFIAKCNANLSFQWVNKITGTGTDDGRSICADNTGNVYITGSINSNATFANGVNLSPGNQIMFVAKYNASNGNYVWHRNQSNSGFNSYAHRIVCDSEGNAYVGGYFFTYMQLGNFQFSAQSSASDLFIAKISANGTWQWSQNSISSDYSDTEYLSDLKINTSDEPYLVCKTATVSSFGFGAKRYLGNNFIFKFDKNGLIKGANVIDSGSNNYIMSIISKNGYNYITGHFLGTLGFGQISLSSASNNGFVAKYID